MTCATAYLGMGPLRSVSALVGQARWWAFMKVDVDKLAFLNKGYGSCHEFWWHEGLDITIKAANKITQNILSKLHIN